MQHPWNHPFGGLLNTFSPKYRTSLLKFRPEVVSHKKKTVSKQSFKIMCLSRNGTYPKLKVLVHLWAQFTPEKPKTLPKTRIFPETTSLWLSNNAGTRSKINHRILIKLIKKIYFGGKNGLFKVKNRLVNKNQEVRGQVRTTFSEAPNSGLTIDQKIFIVARLKLVLFKFWCHLVFFHSPFFDCGPVFRGDTQAIEKKLLAKVFRCKILCWIFWTKKLFKNNHCSRSLLDPENWWCVLVQFEIFEQFLGTVKDS